MMDHLEPKMSQKRWAERFRLVESRGAVLDIAFSPIAGALRLVIRSTSTSNQDTKIYDTRQHVQQMVLYVSMKHWNLPILHNGHKWKNSRLRYETMISLYHPIHLYQNQHQHHKTQTAQALVVLQLLVMVYPIPKEQLVLFLS